MPPLAILFSNIIAFIDHVLVPLVFAIAFIVFLWGVFQYFIAGGANDEQREKGKSFILYGLIGFVVMISLWGIVNLLIASLGFGNQSRPNLPTFNGSGGAYGTPYGMGGTPIYGTNAVVTGGTPNPCFVGMCWPGNSCVAGSCVPASSNSSAVNGIQTPSNGGSSMNGIPTP